MEQSSKLTWKQVKNTKKLNLHCGGEVTLEYLEFLSYITSDLRCVLRTFIDVCGVLRPFGFCCRDDNLQQKHPPFGWWSDLKLCWGDQKGFTSKIKNCDLLRMVWINRINLKTTEEVFSRKLRKKSGAFKELKLKLESSEWSRKS